MQKCLKLNMHQKDYFGANITQTLLRYAWSEYLMLRQDLLPIYLPADLTD